MLSPTPTHTTARTPLAVGELITLTRRVAAEARLGRHPVRVDPERRWYRRLRGPGYSTDDVDVWIICWGTEQYAELHDHGGSVGALTIVGGSLVERRWAPAAGHLRTRHLPAGRVAGFPLGYVHDVANPAPEPAVSVHAYSPPLTAMTYYAVDGASRLRRTRTVLTDMVEGMGPR